MEITTPQQDVIDTIVASIKSAQAGEPLEPSVDRIIQLSRQLVTENPPLVAFVSDIKDLATRESLAAWAETPTARFDSQWDRLLQGLNEIIPD